MNFIDILRFRLRCAIKFLIATIEMFMASAIASGSQSDIVNYFICFFYAQMIFRIYEVFTITSQDFQSHFQVFNILSTSSFVMFVQFNYLLTSTLPLHQDKQEMSALYKGHGELCNLLNYWQHHRTLLIVSYILAVVIKLYNTYYYIHLQINIEAR